MNQPVGDANARDEDRLHKLLASLPDVTWTVAEDGRTVFVSPNAQDIFGESVEDILKAAPATWHGRVHPEDLPGVVQAFQALLSRGQQFDVEFRAQRKDEQWVWVHARAANPQREGSVTYVHGIVSDITARKEAEVTRENHVAILETIISTTPDGIFMLDAKGCVVFMNLVAERLLGYGPSELYGKVLHDVCHNTGPGGEPFPRSACPIARACASGEYLDGYEDVHFRKDGAPMEISFSVSPVFQGARLLCSVLVMQDISKRRQEERRNHALQECLLQAQRMEAVGHLAGEIAHDFNDLLHIINEHSNLILSEESTGPKRLATRAHAILDAGQRAAALTRKILDFKLKDEGDPQIISLSSTAEGMMELFRKLLGEDIIVTGAFQTSGESVRINASQLEQVIMNLVINARDAMPTGGEIHIETSIANLDERDHGFVPRLVPGTFVILSVSDNGCGMDNETVKHIFEPFFTTKGRGTANGLGLFTVYGIVAQNGGGIRVDSTAGAGSTFQVCLPVSQPSVAANEVLERAAFPPATERILLVEDEPAVRSLICGQLRRLGYTVLEAGNGAEAMQLATDDPGSFDLLLTDMIMPRMGGRELSARIREVCPTARVVQMSGYDKDPAMVFYDDHPKFSRLQKPFTLETLAAIVRRAFDEEPS